MSCLSHFNHSLSRKILSKRDPNGRNTITVFTKLYLSSDYVIEKLTSRKIDCKKNPFGYFLVKDNQDTLKENSQESKLLSYFDESHVGLELLSKSIAQGLLAIMLRLNTQIIQIIKDDIANSEIDLKRYQQKFNTIDEAHDVVISIIHATSEILRQLFIFQDYIEYESEPRKHAASLVASLLQKLKKELLDLKLDPTTRFLARDISQTCRTAQIRLTMFHLVLADNF